MSDAYSPFPKPAAAPTRAGLPVATLQFGLAACAGLNLTGAVAFHLVGVAPLAIGLALTFYAVAAGLAVMEMARSYPFGSVGLCNLVTLGRLGLTAALIAPIFKPEPTWALLAVAVFSLALDGVDGWFAKRFGNVSDFGARFDMEVDTALAVVLALNAWAAGTVGAVVLVLALPRYGFALAGRIWPWLARELPPRFSRKVVCVVQIAALIALQIPTLPDPLAGAIVAITAAALIWSFGRDMIWLSRART